MIGLYSRAVNHEVFLHISPSAGLIMIKCQHAMIITSGKLIAFTPSPNLQQVRQHFVEMIPTSCYIIKANSTSDKVPSRGKLRVFEVSFQLPAQCEEL